MTIEEVGFSVLVPKQLECLQTETNFRSFTTQLNWKPIVRVER